MQRGLRVNLAARRVWPVLLGGALVVAVAVGSGAGPAPRYRIDIAVVSAVENALGPFVAEASGFLRAEEVEVGRFIIGSGEAVRTALISGHVPFASTATVHILLAREAGVPVKGVLALYVLPNIPLLVRSGLRDQVRHVRDLRGRIVGASAPGSLSWSMLVAYLRKAGLDPDRDVRFLPLGTNPAVVYTALATGRVDAYAQAEPLVSMVEKDGVAFVLVDIYDPTVAREWTGSSRGLPNVLAAREETIGRSPDLI